MKNIRYIILITMTAACWACLLSPVQAQQRSVFSQYMFNNLLINPAYAGNQNQLSATMLMRSQWVNLEGAPQTQALTAHTNIDKRNIGVGLAMTNEQIGVHSDMGVYASYSYQIKFKNSKLAMGLQGGFNRLSSNFFKLTLKNTYDPLIGNYNKFNPNFGTGLFYSTPRAFVGFSVPYLVHNRLIETTRGEFGEVLSEGKEARYYFLQAGKVFELNRDVLFKPSALVRYQEGAPISADLNINFFLQKVINVGMSYRTSDALIFLFELTLNENFSLGYAYDMTTSNLNAHSSGSHELMINYRINLSPKPCHSFF